MSINPLNDISKVYLEQVSESAVPGKPAEKLGAVTAIQSQDMIIQMVLLHWVVEFRARSSKRKNPCKDQGKA
jgi:hypothetical protein